MAKGLIAEFIVLIFFEFAVSKEVSIYVQNYEFKSGSKKSTINFRLGYLHQNFLEERFNTVERTHVGIFFNRHKAPVINYNRKFSRAAVSCAVPLNFGVRYNFTDVFNSNL